jgi:hypothetical protein
VSRDVLPLFICYVDRYGDKWRATSQAFPGLEGYGKNSEEARSSLAAMVLRFYSGAREKGIFPEV